MITKLMGCDTCRYKAKYDDFCVMFGMSFKNLNDGEWVHYLPRKDKKRQIVSYSGPMTKADPCPHSGLKNG